MQPEGSAVQRRGKWAVSRSEYGRARYPTFCAGLAYLMRPSLARKLLQAAPSVPFFWIDDVYITGLVAAAVGADHFSLNLRYTHHQQDLLGWLAHYPALQPLPFIVTELDTTDTQWPSTAHRFWNETLARP